jgi:hypothetical protein
MVRYMLNKDKDFLHIADASVVRAIHLNKDTDVTNEHHPTDEPQSAPAASLSDKGAARRRFGKAGIGASGVLMTLASTPGMACTTCVSTSGFHSIAIGSSLYGTSKPGVVCQGLPGSSWVNIAAKNWPVSQNATFCSIYMTSGGYFTVPVVKDRYGNVVTPAHELTMLEACKGVADATDGGVAKLFAAAWMNITGTPQRTSYISQTKVKAMFKAVRTNGTFKYSDSSSATWNKSEVLNYMVGTV